MVENVDGLRASRIAWFRTIQTTLWGSDATALDNAPGRLPGLFALRGSTAQ
jgi:hypothetical protein